MPDENGLYSEEELTHLHESKDDLRTYYAKCASNWVRLYHENPEKNESMLRGAIRILQNLDAFVDSTYEMGKRYPRHEAYKDANELLFQHFSKDALKDQNITRQATARR